MWNKSLIIVILIFAICYTTCVLTLLGVADAIIVTTVGLNTKVKCDDKYTYDSYVTDIDYDDSGHFAIVHFTVFKSSNVIFHDWQHEYLADKLPNEIVVAYQQHDILKLYTDCSGDTAMHSVMYYTHHVKYRSKFGIVLIFLIDSGIIAIAVMAVCICCIHIDDPDDCPTCNDCPTCSTCLSRLLKRKVEDSDAYQQAPPSKHSDIELALLDAK